MTTRPKLTQQIAHAAARDAGNASMRKAGRKKWNSDDFYAASRECNRLWPNYIGGLADDCDCEPK